MFTREKLKEECGHTVYQKGLDLCQAKRVRNLRVMEDEETGIIEITADIGNGYTDSFRVNVIVDEEYEETVEYECGCPAFRQQGAMCAHCCAAALAYIFKRDRQYQMLPESMLASRDKPYVRTTPGFSRILDFYDKKDKLSLLQQNLKGKVELTPLLHIDAMGTKLEFRIGCERSYILKNLPNFVSAVKELRQVSYGQKLTFYHSQDCFTAHAWRMVRFLEAEFCRQEFYAASLARFSPGSASRYLALNASNLDDFFQACGEDEVEAVFSGGKAEKYALQEGRPELKLEIKGTRDGVQINGDLPFMMQGLNYVYLWKGRRIYKTEKQDMEAILPFFLFSNTSAEHNYIVSRQELPVFCRELLPVLENYFEIEASDFEALDYLPPQASYQIYLDSPQKDMITCKAYAVYGEAKYNVFAQMSGRGNRDEMGEFRFGQAVSRYFNAFDSQQHQMVLSQEEQFYEFLTDGIYGLSQLGEIYISDALKAIQVRPAPSVSVGVSLSGDLLELQISSDEIPLSELAGILSRYDRKKKYFRLKDGSFLNLENSGLDAVSDTVKTLRITESEMKSGSVLVPKYRAPYLERELSENQGTEVKMDGKFKALIHNMNTAGENREYPVPESLAGILRPYQKQGYLWLKTLKNIGFAGILADDMGLGKTLQVITFLLSEQEEDGRNKSLIVCPASLVYNWKYEIERFAPALKPVILEGNAAQRRSKILQTQAGEILITSYDLLKRDIELYEGTVFSCQIIDEAQYIKNHVTQTSKAVKRIRAGFKIALTGTPVENRLSELWSIFDYLMPGFLYHYSQFKSDFEIPIVQNGSEEEMERLRNMVRPFVLRRLKRDVLKDLPEKLEECVVTKLTGEQAELYQAHLQRMKLMLDRQTEEEFMAGRIQILAELTKLRQLCCDPALIYEGYRGRSAKLDMCISVIKNAIEGGHKILLFSQFTTMLHRIQEELKKENISYFSLTGATPKEKRAAMVEEFNRGPAPVFCISLKAGGTGLNLTSADIVIHYDPWWNIAVQNQATDRAHRIGQTQAVTVYKLIAGDTIEENIVKLQERKKELAQQLFQGDGFSAHSFDRAEIMELLGARTQ